MKIEILIPEISRLFTKTRIEGEEGQITTVQFSAKISPGAIARLLNLQRQGVPLHATVGSNQSAMDLEFQELPEQGRLEIQQYQQEKRDGAR